MRYFQMRELREALAYAKEGGQSLHIHNIIVDERTAPRCFVKAIRCGENIAHLFDLDKDRLIKTARWLGVNVIQVDGEGAKDQHIDLCGSPLRRALEQCGEI